MELELFSAAFFSALFAIVLIAFFFWCYKEVNPPVDETTPMSWRTRWLTVP